MKIKPEHYTVLKDAITAVHNRFPHAEADYQLSKFTPKRLRWDMLYFSKLKVGDGRGMDGLPLYQYMNDDHIDTALKACCRELNLSWAAS